MAKIDFDVNLMAQDLDPLPHKMEFRGGDFVSFRPPISGETVQAQLIGTKVDVFVAPAFPPFQTFKLRPSPVLEGGAVVLRFRSLKIDLKKKQLPPAARKKKITFTIAVKGQNVKVRPSPDHTEIRSGSVVVFKRAAGTTQSVLVELGNPKVYFGIAPSPNKDPRVRLDSNFRTGMVEVVFLNAGGGDPDTKPYP